MQYDDHFSITRLEYGMLDVVVQDVHFITAHRCEAKTCEKVDMIKCVPPQVTLTMHMQVSLNRKQLYFIGSPLYQGKHTQPCHSYNLEANVFKRNWSR